MSNPLIDNLLNRLSLVDFNKLDDDCKKMFAESIALYLSYISAIGNFTDNQLKSLIKDTFEQLHPGVECTFDK